MLSKFFNKYISQKNLYFSILFITVIVALCKNIDIAIMIFVSIIFACSLNPLVDRLSEKMKRPLATTIVLILFLIVVSLFVVPALYLGIYEVTEFAKELALHINNIDDTFNKFPLIEAFNKNINSEAILESFAGLSSGIFDTAMSFVLNLSSAILYIFTSIVLIFFFLVDKDKIKDTMLKFFPSEYRQRTEKIIVNVGKKLSGYVFAQTLVSGSVWLVMTLGLLLFHVPYAILLGLIAGILSIIPIIGSGISLIVCLIATFEFGIKTLIIVTILYTFSHFIENHVVRPYVYSKFLNLHQAVIFLALVVGAKYQGVLGIILAPPFAMFLYILLDELYIAKMDE